MVEQARLEQLDLVLALAHVLNRLALVFASWFLLVGLFFRSIFAAVVDDLLERQLTCILPWWRSDDRDLAERVTVHVDLSWLHNLGEWLLRLDQDGRLPLPLFLLMKSCWVSFCTQSSLILIWVRSLTGCCEYLFFITCFVYSLTKSGRTVLQMFQKNCQSGYFLRLI